ncbi:MAG: right-handed parallel beta-helix repeat-containing protein, partial [Bacteroidia bacterium]
MRTFTIIGLLFSCLSLHAQIYVDTDATGTNDGTSWANAFTFLDTALSSASVNDQIWVAEGIYVPRDSFMSVLILFPITKDIKLYGGFDGTETMLSERDPVQHLTILSGDVNGDDIAGDFLNNRTDNREAISFIADSISSATIIDGFTFRGGHAAGIINNIGAAMTMAGSPLIRNCIFTNNYSRSAGGAVFIGFSDAVYAVIEDCAFSENLCDGFGGAINVQDVRLDGDPLQIINCSFTDNEADNSGGAVRAISSDLRIKGCTFDGNASGSFGGGLSVYQVSPDLKVEVDDNSFIGNQSNVGGGFFYEPENTGNSITVKHCDFKDNTANANGGGLRFFFDPAGRDVDASIHHCTFERNYAEKFGSGANITFAAANVGVDVDSCMFSENSSAPTEIGGSLIIYSGAPSSSLQLSHTTFTQNFGFQGGGLLIETGTGGELTTMVQNCDFTQNTGSFLAGGMSVVVQQGTELLDLNIMDCTFAENRMIRRGGPSRGSAIFLGHADADYDININRCTFTGNKNENGAAGIEIRELAHAQQESGAKIAIENSLFAQHDTGETVIVFTK